MSERIRVFAVSEVRLFREGLCDVLSRQAGFEVVGAAADLSSAIAASAECEPDVLLVSAGHAAEQEAIRRFTASAPGAAVVALAVPDAAEDVIAWVEAGAAAFLTTDASLSDLTAAIRGAHRGEAQCSPRMLGALLRRLGSPPAPSDRRPITHLTVREQEIGRLLASGLSNKEIAGQLHIEVTTVKNHVHNILEKLKVRRRSEAGLLLAGSGRSGSLPTSDLDPPPPWATR